MAVIGGATMKIALPCLRPSPQDGCFVAAYPAERRSILRWPQRGVCLLRRRPPIDPVRSPSWLADPGRWEAAANARLHGASAHYLFDTGRPVQRQGPGRWSFIRRNFLARPACRELPGPQRCRRTVPPAPGGAAAGPQGDHPSVSSGIVKISCAAPGRRMPAISSPGRASSLSLVHRQNDYSVPVAYGHREVLIPTSMRW